MEQLKASQEYAEESVGKQYEKPRLFVREISAPTYSLAEELKRLRSLPRVIKGKDLKFKGGPQNFGTTILTPKNGTSQALYAHMVVMVPGAKSQKHGHMNEAAFYILDGKGHEIHDGKRYDWEAGDLVIVHNGCVHQHFNDSKDKVARALIMKSKPLYLFMNLFFQEFVEEAPKEPIAGWEDFHPNTT